MDVTFIFPFCELILNFFLQLLRIWLVLRPLVIISLWHRYHLALFFSFVLEIATDVKWSDAYYVMIVSILLF
jgi:hypothetical protein